MHLLPFSVLYLIISFVSASQHPLDKTYDTHDYYILEHDPNHALTPEACASSRNLELVEPLGELPNHWVLRAKKDQFVPTKRDNIHPSIKFLEKQSLARLHKRDYIPHRRELSPFSQTSNDIAHRLEIEDPLFNEQWHIVNDQQPQHSLNVVPVWEMGYTGAGITIAMVDDGVDFESTDLAKNFDFQGSWDFNTHQALPKPLLQEDTHGTRCAGQIAAAKNDVCGIGIAYNAKVAGLRILSGYVTPIDEATALNYHYNTTDIYSCSWGPHDDGATLGDVRGVIRKAFVNGVNNGRGGKGSIFVFSSGNGGGADDMCGFDGYNNAIWTVTIGSVNDGGWAPVYSEGCSAVMAVTYSSGSRKHRDITTTDVGHAKCTSEHGGTSAAAPFASGIFALALSARPDLTWRDIQHLVFRTAVVIDPEHTSWEPTKSGTSQDGKMYYSNQYGWGKLDAESYVNAAMTWQLVKPQAWSRSGVLRETGKRSRLLSRNGVTSTFTVTRNQLQDNNFDELGLEHVTVRVWIAAERRGRVQVSLTSPQGVVSLLGKPRPKDLSDTGFDGWMFMSVKHWGESPIGTWTITVSDPQLGSENALAPKSSFQGWSMTLFGSCVDPAEATPYEPEYDSDLEEWDGVLSNKPETTHSTRLPRPSLPIDTAPPAHAESDESETSSFRVLRRLSVLLILSGVLLAGMVLALCVWSRERTTAKKRGNEYKYQRLEVRKQEESDYS